MLLLALNAVDVVVLLLAELAHKLNARLIGVPVAVAVITANNWLVPPFGTFWRRSRVRTHRFCNERRQAFARMSLCFSKRRGGLLSS
jgi:hypothetical protein